LVKDKLEKVEDKIMSSEKMDLSIGLKLTTNVNQGYFYQGRNSCQCCRYVNYNGEVCSQPVSPLYAKKVGAENWCRFWSPKVGQNIPLTK
jgi:hypothetical protein